MLKGRLFGVSLVVDWSWLVVLALVTWSFADNVFPHRFPDLTPTSYAAMAVAGSVLFFGSVLVHEMCHTLASRREGVPVTRIRLFLFGGASESAEPLPGPGAELRVVAAGPLSTAALTSACFLLADGGSAVGLPVQVTGVLGYLGELNLMLLVFNLLPALPLDGGRLVHAWLWHRSGDPARSTLRAATGGRVLGVLLVVLGVLATSAGEASGLWLVLMGGFLLLSVQQEITSARTELAFGGRTVADVMTTSVVTLSPEMTVTDLSDLLRSVPSHSEYPVVDHGRLRGLLVLETAGRVPIERRPDVRVADLMLTGTSVPRLRHDVPLMSAARLLASPPGRAVVLVGDDQLVGIVSASDLARLATSRGLAHA